MRVIKDRHSHAAIEIDPEARLLLRRGDENSLILQEHPETWFEILDGIGRIEYHYDQFWVPMLLPSGEAYHPVEALRKMMRGAISAPTAFGPGVLETVMEYLPEGETHLFVPELGFLGRYACPEDAEMIAAAHGFKPAEAITFSNYKELCRLPAAQQTLVALAVGAPIPKKFTPSTLQEILVMSSKAKRKKMQQPGGTTAKKKDVATGRQKPGPSRADGPVAKAREIFAKHKGLDTAAIRAECEKAGINKGTVGVQLGKWRKENGVVVDRAKPAVKAKKDAPALKAKKKAAAPAKVKLDPVANAIAGLKAERVPGQDDEERTEAAAQ